MIKVEYTIDKDKITEIAKELGLEVSFDSKYSGVLNTKTGERKSISSYLEFYLSQIEEDKYD